MNRNKILSVSPDGRVYHDGFLMGAVESLHTAWGDEIWGYRIAGINMSTYYVDGARRDAVAACAAAFRAHRRRLADLRSG